MAEKRRKKVNVKVLDKEKIARAGEIRVLVKGGRTFTFRVSRPLFNGKKLILHDESGVIMVTSLSGLARDVENYFEKQGLTPLYIYPVSQRSLFD
jgi:hypothetical protein